jgi:hypothetical protein
LFFDRVDAFYQTRTEFSTNRFSANDQQIGSALPDVAVLVQLLV